MKQNAHKHIKILVVDDEPDNLGVISGYLKDEGYRYFIASNGKTAIERAARIKPGVILLDVKMPGMDGFEVCRRLMQIENALFHHLRNFSLHFFMLPYNYMNMFAYP